RRLRGVMKWTQRLAFNALPEGRPRGLAHYARACSVFPMIPAGYHPPLFLPLAKEYSLRIDDASRRRSTRAACASAHRRHAGGCRLGRAEPEVDQPPRWPRAVREFVLTPGHGEADYVLFVQGKAVGVLEAKPAGHTLSGVEAQ